MDSKACIQVFDQQVETLLQRGYAESCGKSPAEFRELCAPLKDAVAMLQVLPISIESGYLPFVLVVKNTLVPTETAMSFVEKDGKKGITKLFPLFPNDFMPIADESIPESPVYLIVAIDRGKETINLPPSEAMISIKTMNRHPLTIDEGVAIITQYSQFLIKNNCFSLLASRHQGDKRVPAIWINSHKQPNLGWCWDGNPHTWLGSASCEQRVGLLGL